MPVAQSDDAAVSPAEARLTLWCSAAGALLGLTMAAYSLFTAKGTRTTAIPPEDVALVNGVPILASDFIDQLRQVDEVSLDGSTSAQRKKVLDDMIREELIVQRGVELGLQSDIVEVRAALVGAVEAQATNTASLVPPSDADLRKFYEAHRAKYSDEGEMQLTDYVASRPVAAESLAELRRTEGDPEIISRLGLSATNKVSSREFYFAVRAHLGETLFLAAVRLHDGEISEPIWDGNFYHVIFMHKNVLPVVAPFESVIDRVSRDYVDEQARHLQARTDAFLRQRADILIQRRYE